MKSLKNILVPYDFSDACNSALNFSIDYIKGTEIKLYILHVITTTKLESLVKKNLITNDKNIAKIQATKYIRNKLQRVLNSKDISNYTLVLKKGDLTQNLISAIKEYKIDMCFLGIHGKPGNKRILNSRALGLIDHIPIPVMTLQNCKTKIQFKNIAYPVYNEEDAVLKTTTLNEIEFTSGKNIYVINKPYKKKEDALQNQKSCRIIRRTCANLRMKHIEVSSTHSPDNFDYELLEQCKALNIDLISIMNSHNEHNNWYKKSHEDNLLFNPNKIPVLCFPDPQITDYYKNT